MLSGDKVRLRPIEERDMATLYLWMQDAVLLRSINRTEKTTWSSHIDWYRRLLHDESQILFSVEAVEDGLLVGQCGLKKVDYKNRKAELWVFIGDNTIRGNGYGSEAVKKLVSFAFEEKGLNRLYLYVVDFNLGVKRFYQQMGFRQEGFFKQDVCIDGIFHDTIHMALLREEYNGLQK
jgi:RimJ/RimL family protein N-acetyltransferase